MTSILIDDFGNGKNLFASTGSDRVTENIGGLIGSRDRRIVRSVTGGFAASVQTSEELGTVDIISGGGGDGNNLSRYLIVYDGEQDSTNQESLLGSFGSLGSIDITQGNPDISILRIKFSEDFLGHHNQAKVNVRIDGNGNQCVFFNAIPFDGVTSVFDIDLSALSSYLTALDCLVLEFTNIHAGILLLDRIEVTDGTD